MTAATAAVAPRSSGEVSTGLAEPAPSNQVPGTMKWTRSLGALVLAIVGTRSNPSEAAVSPPDPVVRGIVADNSAFAIDLYAQLRNKPGNVVFAPVSISTTFAMALAGARGETAVEMQKALHFSRDPQAVDQGFARLLSAWLAPSATGGPEIQLANRVWCQAGLGLVPEFVEVTSRDYHAPVASLDFRRDAEGARVTINHWVEEQTRDKIKDLIAPGALDTLTRLVLTNAIYFRGNWASRFEEQQTRPEDFFTDPRRGHPVPMMHQKLTTGYAAVEGAQVLELGYTGADPNKAFSLVIVLPNDRDGLARLESGLRRDQLSSWLGQIRRDHVALSLPRFQLTSGFELSEPMKAMGMQRAFTDHADFSGISTDEPLSISSAVHQAFVSVDENGTVAAASTAVIVHTQSAVINPSYIELRVDHPFLVILRDQITGSILFMGRVVDPAM